jgi:hypothetical protein
MMTDEITTSETPIVTAPLGFDRATWRMYRTDPAVRKMVSIILLELLDVLNDSIVMAESVADDMEKSVSRSVFLHLRTEFERAILDMESAESSYGPQS